MSNGAPAVRVPGDLPDLRLWLSEQWMPGRPYFTGAARALTTRVPGEIPNPVKWARGEFDALRQSGLWWVGADMVDLLLATAAGVPDDVKVQDLEPPAQAGMVVFEKPWWGIDAESSEREVQVDCLVWFRTRLSPTVRPGAGLDGVHCLSVSVYRRLDFDAGMGPAELSLAISTGAMLHADLSEKLPEERTPVVDTIGRDGHGDYHLIGDDPDGMRPALPGETVAHTHLARGQTWVPLGRSDWPLEDRIDVAPWPMHERMLTSFVEDRKVVAALWTLLHTEGITSRVEHGVPRQAARRSERAGIDKAVASRVQVVTLRKLRRDLEDGEEHEQRKVEHDHRWMVSGHYRWQPFGKGREERRLIFIAPHIKGPDDKPLKVRDRVNAFVR